MIALMILDALNHNTDLKSQHTIKPTQDELDFIHHIQHLQQTFDPYSEEQQLGADYARYNTTTNQNKQTSTTNSNESTHSSFPKQT